MHLVQENPETLFINKLELNYKQKQNMEEKRKQEEREEQFALPGMMHRMQLAQKFARI